MNSRVPDYSEVTGDPFGSIILSNLIDLISQFNLSLRKKKDLLLR